MQNNFMKLFATIFAISLLAPAASAGWWAGYVIDQNASTAVQATVLFANINTNATFNTTSNSTGFFNATGLSDGAYTITFSNNSYVTKTYDYSNSTARYINNSNPAQTGYFFNPAFFNFTLQPNPQPALLWGIVRDAATSAQIPGATVVLSTGASGTTNATGAYSFVLSPLTLNASASATSYSSVQRANIVTVAGGSVQEDFALNAAPTPSPTPPPSTGGGRTGGFTNTPPQGCLYANPVCGTGFFCDYRNNECLPEPTQNATATPSPSPTAQPGAPVEIRTPPGGTQGDFLTVQIVDAQTKQPLNGVGLQVKFPDNRMYSLPSDERGEVRFVAEVAGIYSFDVAGRAVNKPTTKVFTRPPTNNANSTSNSTSNKTTTPTPAAGGFAGFFTAANAPLLAGLLIAVILAVATAYYLSKSGAAKAPEDEKASHKARLEELQKQKRELDAKMAEERKALRAKPKTKPDEE